MTVNPDLQYHALVERILTEGDRRIDRTGVGTLAVFGAMARFDLSEGHVPLLTTKRVYWKAAVKEMLWFLSGDTSIRSLLQQNVRVWTAWPLQKYRRETGHDISQVDFETRILEDPVFSDKYSSIGPSYGFQWRKWPGKDGQPIDQVANTIELIRNDPSSRRILFHAWNTSDLDDMAIPPCHLLYTFHVSKSKNTISLSLVSRSADVGLGLVWNQLAASALLLMVAQQTGYTPGELIWYGTDTHIYLNHIDGLRQQLAREPRAQPTMRLIRKPASIDDYTIDDFLVEGYDPHPPIDLDVAV